MDFDEYQVRSAITDQRPDPRDISFPLLGLAGEVGSLVAEYKKLIRGDTISGRFLEEAREDLGDLLWYVSALARTLDLPLSEIANSNLQKIHDAWGTDLPPPSTYDVRFPDTPKTPSIILGAIQIA